MNWAHYEIRSTQNTSIYRIKIYIYVPDCKISLGSFVLYFHLLLIRSFIRNRSCLFVSWSFLQKLNLKEICMKVYEVENWENKAPPTWDREGCFATQYKVDRLQIIAVAKKFICVSQLFISRIPKMSAIPQLVSAPLNPMPIAKHFRRSHPPC